MGPSGAEPGPPSHAAGRAGITFPVGCAAFDAGNVVPAGREVRSRRGAGVRRGERCPAGREVRSRRGAAFGSRNVFPSIAPVPRSIAPGSVARHGRRLPCPCCGHLIFLEPPGSYDICEICFWEDDIVMLRWPTSGGGANHASLVEAQRNYAEFGASERARIAHVRTRHGRRRGRPRLAPDRPRARQLRARGRARGAMARRTRPCSTGGGRRSGAATARPPDSRRARPDRRP